ncbi:MAG TPA: ABC transporter ATP-binding protein [Polyangiaceae bacterium]
MRPIEVRNVTKIYGPVRALVGVSCEFLSGSLTSIQGPNGSGKSTLLSIVGTLTRPTSGTIDHGALGKGRAVVRRHLGWVGHESLCYLDLSGRQNIELAAHLHAVDARAACARVAERLDLGAFFGRPMRTCSRGQRQRIALARALVNEPRLLLLDEPTTGLDLASCNRLAAVMADELSRGTTIVMVTHDVAFAAALSGRTVVLERGRVAGANNAAGARAT